jgi:hypothetical protein
MIIQNVIDNLKDINYEIINSNSLLIKNLIITIETDINNLQLLELHLQKPILVVSDNIENYSPKYEYLFIADKTTSFSDVLIDRIAWLIDIDNDFDEIKYLEQFPAIIDYYQPWANENGISEKRRLFHHCFIYQIPRNEIVNIEVDEDFEEKFYEEEYPDSKSHCSFWTDLDNKKKLFHHYITFGRLNKYKKSPKNKYSIPQNNKKSIYIKVQNGLANRVRTINSFYSLSMSCGKNLFVCWESGSGWSDDKFTDLFINQEINLISEEEYSIKTSKIFNLESSVKKSDDSLSYVFSDPVKDIFYKIMSEDFCYSGDSCLEYMMPQFFKEQNYFYAYLRPVQLIQDKIDKVCNLINNDTIGVHIRRGDAWNSKGKNQFKVSDDQSFFDLLDQEIYKNPNINFFLSTDSEETNTIYLNKYKDRILYNTEKLFFNSVCESLPKYHQDDAVIDLFLLSKTSKIIGSNWSSFSALSSKISHKPLLIAGRPKINEELSKDINHKIETNISGNSLLEVKSIPWQFPALTEKQSFYNHSNIDNDSVDNLYIACPWANIIDALQNQFPECHNYDDFLQEPNCQNYLDNIFDIMQIPSSKNTHTVCQHINWHKLLGFWKKIGIKNIHVSHLTTKSYQFPLDDINLFPWHIYAANVENGNRHKGIKIKSYYDKQYLCSFIGAYNIWYPSDIRDRLYQLLKNNNKVYFKLKDSWFFNNLVYKKQIRQQTLSEHESYLEKIETVEYNTVLSDSVFSLCPEGTGPNTIRLWESMAVGSIPVMFENDWIRPNIEGYNWDDFSITISTTDFKNVFEILKSISVDKIETMKQNCINAYNITRLKTCF